MKRSGMIAAVALLAGMTLASGDARAAGFANTSQSAVANSMAATGVANPEEPNANFYNPAGMAGREGFESYLGVTLIAPNTSFDPEGGGEGVNTESAVFPPPNLHAAYGINDSVSVGLGITLPWGLAISWPDDWPGRESIQRQQLQTLNINPNVAVKIGDTGLKVAVGGQVMLSSLELDRKIILRSDKEVQVNLGGNGQGFGATAAVMYQPIEELSFGVNYRSAVHLNYEGVAHFEDEEGTPFENTFVDGPVSTGLTVPHFLAAGVGYRLDRLFLELDFNYTTWSTYDEVVIDFENNKPSDTSTITANWHDAVALRFGASYDVLDNLPIRLGFAYDRTPIPDETVSPSLPGNHRLSAAIGAGYSIGSFRFDAGYQLVSAMSRDLQNDKGPDGTYKTTAHVIGLNAGYGFDFGK